MDAATFLKKTAVEGVGVGSEVGSGRERPDQPRNSRGPKLAEASDTSAPDPLSGASEPVSEPVRRSSSPTRLPQKIVVEYSPSPRRFYRVNMVEVHRSHRFSTCSTSLSSGGGKASESRVF